MEVLVLYAWLIPKSVTGWHSKADRS